MYGPHWNDPETGVTGERNDRQPNYVIVIVDGVTRTYTGERAQRILAAAAEEPISV
jgi:hypothetical protein